MLTATETQAAPVPKRYMSRKELAEYTGIAASTINNYHTAGRGPLMIQIGGRVVYDRFDVDTWLASFKVDPANRPVPTDGKRRRGRPWPQKTERTRAKEIRKGTAQAGR